jgi:hypothetical protein
VMNWAARARSIAVAAVLFVAMWGAGLARADETVNSCGNAPNEIFGHAAIFGINTYQNCPAPAGAYLEIATAGNRVAAGHRATWQATAPQGLLIKDVTVPAFHVNGINDGKQYGGGFYWHAGGVSVHDGGWSGFFGADDGDAGFPSPYFGFQIVCGASPCTSSGAYFLVEQAQLDVEETAGPSLVASGLWGQQGWLRGDWPIWVSGDSPSGVCGLSAAVDGQLVASQAFSQDTSAWHQCNAAGAGGMSRIVHTSQFSNTVHRFSVFGSDAAGANTGTNYATTIHTDNSIPTISLSGPVDAATTAGTQFITATAGGSPSGIADIICHIDGGAEQRYNGSDAQIPVSGIGQHTVSCSAENNAVTPSGAHARSTMSTWGLKIGLPTLSAISFTSIANKLRCSRVHERVKLPGHWVVVRRHHRLIRVHRRPKVKVVTVTRCHPRIVRRRITVWVTVHRHGKKLRVKRRRLIRVAVPPRLVAHATRRVSHGQGTTVSGWLGTVGNVALGGAAIRVLTAPDNGLGQFSLAAVATSAANGAWTARLPAGPSRVVEAIYDGGPTTESSISGQVRLIVPAEVKIRISPRIVLWGSIIRITGRVLGGYVPANSNLLRLNVGIGRIGQLEGLPQIHPDGRFLIVWKFDAGHGVLHPWFSVGTLSESAFPWAPGTSKRVAVTLGKPTPVMAKHHHRKHTHRKRHTRR